MPDINEPLYSWSLPMLPDQEDIEIPARTQRRGYYPVYGSTPAYYPTFDPLSVLASLAFLAFLLQSVASIFDRSRSILPTISSSRRSVDLQTADPSAKRILEILAKYENHDRMFAEDTDDDITWFFRDALLNIPVIAVSQKIYFLSATISVLLIFIWIVS